MSLHHRPFAARFLVALLNGGAMMLPFAPQIAPVQAAPAASRDLLVIKLFDPVSTIYIPRVHR